MADVESAAIRPTPAGATAVAGFTSDVVVREALLSLVRERIKSAISTREGEGVISSRGDAAANLFLDRERIETLLAGPEKHAEKSVVSKRRETSLLRRLAATDSDGSMLALALHRWKLSLDDLVIFSAVLASTLSPQLSRLLSFLGGDASRPGLSVAAAASLLATDATGISQVELMLGKDGRLGFIDLVTVQGADQPFLARTLTMSEHVRGICVGAEASRLPVTPIPATTTGPTHFSFEDAAKLRTLATRYASPVLAWIHGRRDTGLDGDLARLLAIDGVAVVSVESAAILSEVSVAAIRREALRLGAVVAIDHNLPTLGMRDAITLAAAIDELTATLPVYFVNHGLSEPRLPTKTPRIVVVAKDSDAALRQRVLDESADTQLSAEQRSFLAHNLPGGPELLRGVGAILGLHQHAASDATELAAEIAAQQLGAFAMGPVRRAAPPPPWSEIDISAGARETLRRAATMWRERQRNQLVVLIQSKPQTDPVAVAAAFCSDLQLPLVLLDLTALRSIARPIADYEFNRALEAAATNNALAVDVGMAGGAWRDRPNELGLAELEARLDNRTGLFLICARGDLGESWRSIVDIAIVDTAEPPTPQGLWTEIG